MAPTLPRVVQRPSRKAVLRRLTSPITRRTKMRTIERLRAIACLCALNIFATCAFAQVSPQIGASNFAASGVLLNTASMSASLSANFPNGVWRLDSVSGSGSPPVLYLTQIGTCAANSMVNDGGSCINDAGGNSFKARISGLLDIRIWGAIPGANNAYAAGNSAAMNAATTAVCNGLTGQPYIPSAHWRYSATVTVACPMMVKGDGRYNTILESTNTTQIGFNVTTSLSTTFEDLQFAPAAGVTPSGGSFVQFAVSGGNNLESSFHRVLFNSYWHAVDFLQAAHWVINDCTFYGNVAGSVALDISNTFNVDAGDSTVSDSFLGGYAANTQGIIYRSSGGLRLSNNKYVGLTTDVTVALASGAVTSDLLIDGGSMEGFTGQAIRIYRAGVTGELDNVKVEGVQFGEPQPWANLIKYTETIGDTTGAHWAVNNATSALNAYASPDGNSTASSYTATQQYGNIDQSVTLAGNTQYTFSEYVQYKSGTNQAPTLVCSDDGGVSSFYTQAIAPTANWVRYSLTFTTISAPHGSLCGLQDSGASGWATYAVWGANLSVGTAETYVPAGAAQTYAAPIIAVDTDGNGAWINTISVTGNLFDNNLASATNLAIASVNGWLYDGNNSACAGGTCTQFVSTPNATNGTYGVNNTNNAGTWNANITGDAASTKHVALSAGGG